MGLIVSIERRLVPADVFGSLTQRVKVQWLDGSDDMDYNMNDLELVSESR